MSTVQKSDGIDFTQLPAKIRELVETESDRGIILILAAYLEEILGLILKAAIVSPKLAANTLAHRQVLGDFDSRLSIAEAFGLIHSEDAQALRLVQKIRNKAAHFDRSGRGFDVLFNSPATADQVRELSRVIRETRPAPHFESTTTNSLRTLFTDDCLKLVAHLIGRLNNVTRFQAPPTTKEAYAAAGESFREGPLREMALEVERLRAEGKREEVLQIGEMHATLILMLRPDLDENLRLMASDLQETMRAELTKLRQSNSNNQPEQQS